MSLDTDKIINTLIRRVVGYTQENLQYIQSYFYKLNLKTDYNWFTAFIYYNSIKNEFLTSTIKIFETKIKNITFNIFLVPSLQEVSCSYKNKTINIKFAPFINLEDNNDLLSYNYIIEKMKKSIVHELEHYEQDIIGTTEKTKQNINDIFNFICYFIESNELDATGAAAYYIHKRSKNTLSFLRSVCQEFNDRFEIGANTNKIQDVINRLEDINTNTALSCLLLLNYFIYIYIPSKQKYYNLVKDDPEYKQILSKKPLNLEKIFENIKQIMFYINDNKLIYKNFNNVLSKNTRKILKKPYIMSQLLLNSIEDFIEENKK